MAPNWGDNGGVRALYVAFDVFPRPKGSSSHIASMIAALAGDFGPVCVLCLGDATLAPFEEVGSVSIYRMAAVSRDVLARATAFAQFVEFHARRLADSLELIVFRDPWGGIPAMRGANGVPTVFEVNALPSWEMAYSRPGFAESPTLQAKLGDMERACLRGAAAVLCVSAVTRRALVSIGVAEERVYVIPNAASETYFRGIEEPCAIPSILDGEWCGYVGGLQAWQGVEFLIDAFAMTGVGKLVIVHSGHAAAARELERRVARHRLEGRVLVHGPLAPAALASVFARVRFTVAPLAETARNTWQGCCPVKIVESMAAGTPVLASDLAVSRELITHGENGWLAAAGDKRAWALGLERLFLDRALRDRLAAAAIFSARDNFCQAIAHEELNTVFRLAAGMGVTE